MKSGLWLYIRCSIRNRFTLAGYLLILIALFLPYLIDIFPDLNPDSIYEYVFISLYSAFILLASTTFGFLTYHSYKKVMWHIQRFKKVNIEKTLLLYKNFYCDRVGAELAIKDAKAKKLI